MGMALLFTSCKSSQSAYKQAYEKAKAQEATTEATQTAPVATEETAPIVPVREIGSAPVRSEIVVSVYGDLKTYSVVCGSFGVKENAQGLCSQLLDRGYKAGIVKNSNMYRVYIGTYDDKNEALRALSDFKAAHPNREDFQGSWILLKK